MFIVDIVSHFALNSLYILHNATVMEVKAAPADLCPETLYREKAELYQMVGALASNRQSPKIN